MLSQTHAGQQLTFQPCHKHFGSSSKMDEAMVALCRHWKLHAHCQRFSLVPPWALSFWAKAIGVHFFKTFHVKSNCWVPATTNRFLNLTRFFSQIVAVCVKPLCVRTFSNESLASPQLSELWRHQSK